MSERIEAPYCNFCGSDLSHHKKIIYNVNDKATDLVECDICNLRFFSPRIKWSVFKEETWTLENPSAVEVAENLFNKGVLLGEIEDPEKQKKDLKDYYNFLINRIKSISVNLPKSVLEIGCNVGWFLSTCKDNNVEILDGIDINPRAVEIANSKMNLPGVKRSDFCEDKIDKEYEWIVMLDYIEHSYDPYGNLKKCYNSLADNGFLIIKTFLEELDLDHSMLCPPFHCYHFYGHVLYKMISTIGFKIYLWEIGGDQVLIIAKKEI